MGADEGFGFFKPAEPRMARIFTDKPEARAGFLSALIREICG
jgi:hypothetical protein